MKGILAEVNVFINEDQFLLAALTRACKFKNDSARMRLPISKRMLNMIIQATFNMFESQEYLGLLYATMFSTSYFGLLRVGEVSSGSHPILVTNVHIGKNKDKILIILLSSKTPKMATNTKIFHRRKFTNRKQI